MNGYLDFLVLKTYSEKNSEKEVCESESLFFFWGKFRVKFSGYIEILKNHRD